MHPGPCLIGQALWSQAGAGRMPARHRPSATSFHSQRTAHSGSVARSAFGKDVNWLGLRDLHPRSAHRTIRRVSVLQNCGHRPEFAPAPGTLYVDDLNHVAPCPNESYSRLFRCRLTISWSNGKTQAYFSLISKNGIFPVDTYCANPRRRPRRGNRQHSNVLGRAALPRSNCVLDEVSDGSRQDEPAAIGQRALVQRFQEFFCFRD